jgi:metallohydrolase, glycoprotease/Kae1 family
MAWDVPVVPVNHMEGHIVSVFANGEEFAVEKPNFPALSLLISGGHTELVLMNDWQQYEKIGQTRDDAVGEAFDKVGRLLGLAYPGGPKISQLARAVRDTGRKVEPELPRPMLHSDDYDFSFSGLKTAVRREVEGRELSESEKEDIAYAFEEAVTEVLFAKTKRAIEQYGIKTLIIAGGVAANKHIRETFTKLSNTSTLSDSFGESTSSNVVDMDPPVKPEGVGLLEQVIFPDLELTGDNSLMIAVAGYYKIKQNNTYPLESIVTEGNLSL